MVVRVKRQYVCRNCLKDFEETISPKLRIVPCQYCYGPAIGVYDVYDD